MQRACFDRGWRFQLSDPLDMRWQEPDYETWRLVDLPHDWSVELERDAENPSGSSGGYFGMGMGHYYKTFSAPEDWRGKRVFIEFEGVYMNAEVWLNGNLVGRHPYGYTSFCYDLTPYLEVGAENVLSVVVDNAFGGTNFAQVDLNGGGAVDITIASNDDANEDVNVGTGNAAGTAAGSALNFYVGAGNSDASDTGGTMTGTDTVVIIYQVQID